MSVPAVGEVAGVVLAGGMGKRIGGPKAGLVLEGVTLVERAIGILEGAGCSPVVVVSQPGIELPKLRSEVVFDPPGDAGPLGGIVGGLSAVDTDEVIVLACDLPCAGPLVARLAAEPGTRVAVAGDGRIQPLCARYLRVHALTAARVAVAARELRLTSWAGSLHPVLERATADELRNINGPADLLAVRRHLRRGGR